MHKCIVNDVHAARATRGMTQEELADAIGVSRQTVIAIEKGNYAPSVILAMKIAHVFNKRVEDLFHITD